MDGMGGGAASGLEARLARELEALRTANLYRTRRTVSGTHGASIVVDGKPCVNFCSNDYLGLAGDPRVAEAARAALLQAGTGSGAAALISGYNHEHRLLEEALAAYCGRERALLFSSGWAANLGTLRALLGRESTLIADELNHASLIDGGRLSGARYVRVAHADVSGYAAALQQARSASQEALVVTDSVFSMDGDLAPVPELLGLCEQHGASLMVDDAHGLGVLPPPAERLPAPVLYVGTLGKALGCAGAFVAGSETLIEFLVQRARSWVFSTAPPPALAAAARASLGIVAGAEGDQRRAALQSNLDRFHEGCRQLGRALGSRATPIQPLVLGDEGRALRLSRALLERGLWVAAIRPPTVPRGTARLRITLSAAHTGEQVDRLVEALHAELARE